MWESCLSAQVGSQANFDPISVSRVKTLGWAWGRYIFLLDEEKVV